jgi:hypothetical protein
MGMGMGMLPSDKGCQTGPHNRHLFQIPSRRSDKHALGRDRVISDIVEAGELKCVLSGKDTWAILEFWAVNQFPGEDKVVVQYEYHGDRTPGVPLDTFRERCSYTFFLGIEMI